MHWTIEAVELADGRVALVVGDKVGLFPRALLARLLDGEAAAPQKVRTPRKKATARGRKPGRKPKAQAEGVRRRHGGQNRSDPAKVQLARTLHGAGKTLKEISERTGIGYQTLWGLKKRGELAPSAEAGVDTGVNRRCPECGTPTRRSICPNGHKVAA